MYGENWANIGRILRIRRIIVDLRFARLMEVDLSGNPTEKRIVIQPMPYSEPGVETQPNAPRSQGRVWKTKLGA